MHARTVSYPQPLEAQDTAHQHSLGAKGFGVWSLGVGIVSGLEAGRSYLGLPASGKTVVVFLSPA